MTVFTPGPNNALDTRRYEGKIESDGNDEQSKHGKNQGDS
jgi:hypothetical protein